MDLTVREMRLDEVHLVVDYFYAATPEYLEMMGVDPSRLLPRQNALPQTPTSPAVLTPAPIPH